MSRESTSVQEVEKYSPSVTVYVAGDKRLIPSNYNNIEDIIYQDCENISKFFAKSNFSKSDIIIFLGEKDNVAEEKSISCIVEKLKWCSNNGFGALYSDMIISSGSIEFVRHYPSYSLGLLKTIMDIPFAVINSTNIKFDSRITKLSLWNGLIDISQFCLLYQSPEPFFRSSDDLSPISITNDIKIINELYFA